MDTSQEGDSIQRKYEKKKNRAMYRDKFIEAENKPEEELSNPEVVFSIMNFHLIYLPQYQYH